MLSTPDYYLRLGCAAMACRFEVWLNQTDRSAVRAVREGFAEVRNLDRRFSLFHRESELSILNRTAHLGPVPVAEDLFELLQFARRITRLSNGAHDVTSGALSRCWGLLERRARIPTPAALDAARRLTGWERVHFDEHARTVVFDVPGVELNLGSLGKGYALDRLASRLARAGVLSFLGHAGSSTIIAHGNAAEGRGWRVRVRSGGDPGRIECLVNEALSTSGSHEQTFGSGGERLCHILDPRRGRPSSRMGSVSAIARTGVMSEAVSTALFLLDGAPARRLLEATGARRCA